MGIQFQLVAYTAAAGKFTPGAYLNGNEDNFYIDDDLRDDIPWSCKSGDTVTLSDEGMIMVVADGMGGMNAGEVASDIAVQTVKEFFTTAKITKEMSSSYDSRRQYLEKVIRECDKRIKEDARNNPAHEGMGSTIILAWIANGEATISWLGDSRAYRFNPSSGLECLSKDHSYVQTLVDKGLITYEQSFDHPQGNIVLKSLGDPSSKPKPESRNYVIKKDDIFILCSDGLSGVLRDRQSTDPATGLPYPEENIEDIVSENFNDINKCREALFEAAERGDWYDNVTAVICKIVADNNGDGKVAEPALKEYVLDDKEESPEKDLTNNQAPGAAKANSANRSLHISISKSTIVYVAVGILIIIAAIVGAVWFLRDTNPKNKAETVTVTDDAAEDKGSTQNQAGALDSDTIVPETIESPASEEPIEKNEESGAEAKKVMPAPSKSTPKAKSSKSLQESVERAFGITPSADPDSIKN